jgi:hypothetical protein
MAIVNSFVCLPEGTLFWNGGFVCRYCICSITRGNESDKKKSSIHVLAESDSFLWKIPMLSCRNPIFGCLSSLPHFSSFCCWLHPPNGYESGLSPSKMDAFRSSSVIWKSGLMDGLRWLHALNHRIDTDQYVYFSRSILDGYFNPLVFWYQWEYPRSPTKNLIFCRVSKIGNDHKSSIHHKS